MAHRHSETQTMRATSAVPGYVLWKILFCQETPLAPYAATFDIDFATPYISSYYAFGKSLPDKVTPYGIASLLKDFVIKDIRIDVYDRRRSH